MLDFRAVRAGEMSFDGLCAGLRPADLLRLTEEMTATVQELIAACVDQDVTFLPDDPEAHDPYATDPEEVGIAWTLGHVVVHITASSEESAFLAAEMARGVPYRAGRSRFEIPWQELTTIAGCRQRLRESLRMRSASLALWPDEPHLANQWPFGPSGTMYNAITRFVLGLLHEYDHHGQLADIVGQARAAR
jgi:hypothetical protein